MIGEYFAEISKYITAALMAAYTLCSLGSLWDVLGKKKAMYAVRCLLVFLIQMCLFAELAVTGRDMEYVYFCFFVQGLFLVLSVMTPIIYEKADRLLLNNMCLLLGIGFAVISRISLKKALRQYIIALISIAIALFIPWMLTRFRIWKGLTWVYGLTGALLLSVVLILGEVTRGSMLSFTIKEITFQPSEFVKIIFLFFLAGALYKKPRIDRIALSAAFAGLYVILLVVSKDLGGALIFFACYVFVVFMATKNSIYLFLGAVGGTAAAYVSYQLFDHVRSRVLAWRDPWAYIDTKGYAVTQSLFAIGSGRWFGTGLLRGAPTLIPFVELDFIFSAVCEELGVIFGICLVLLTLCCFLEMLKTASFVRDRFYQLIVYGAGVVYIFQVFLTVGGGVNMIPLTGVTLPLVSYGGSSVMATIFIFFIVQGIYIRFLQEGGDDSDKTDIGAGAAGEEKPKRRDVGRQTAGQNGTGRKGVGRNESGEKTTGRRGSERMVFKGKKTGK